MVLPPEELTSCPAYPTSPTEEDLNPEHPNWSSISVFVRELGYAYDGCDYKLKMLVKWINDTKTTIETPVETKK